MTAYKVLIGCCSSYVCSTDLSYEAGGIDNGFSSALTPRSTSRTMALCLISRSVGGVIILGVKGDGDVRDFSPGSTSFYPVHREGGELIDFGFSSEEHTSELQSLMRISYDVFCLQKKTMPINQPK